MNMFGHLIKQNISNIIVFLLAFVFALSAWASPNVEAIKTVDAQTFDRWMSDLSNWGRWGKDDERGAINLITPGKRISAARLVKKGIAVSLGRDLDKRLSNVNPHPFVHEMTIQTHSNTTYSKDRYVIDYHGPTQSHLDALCHMFHNEKMYNGFSQNLVTERGCQKLSVSIVNDGIFTRGVLIDLAFLKGVDRLRPDDVIFPSDLNAWEKKSGVQIKPGDAVFIRTGRDIYQDHLVGGGGGLHASTAIWFKEKDVSIIGTDYPGDIWPTNVEGEAFPFHKLVMIAMGTQMFDNLDLEGLKAEAIRQNRWDFLFTFSPMRVEGGTGSPVNPTAIF